MKTKKLIFQNLKKFLHVGRILEVYLEVYKVFSYFILVATKNYFSGQKNKAVMLIKAKPNTTYEIIEDLINKDDNLLNIKLLCEIAGVSRSGFYNWKSNKIGRQTKENSDKSDLELINVGV